MKLPNARYRVVNFRLSSSEYEAVYCACQSEGVPTVSEFARSSILRRVHGEPISGGNADFWLLKLSERVSSIERNLDLVLRTLKTQEVEQKPSDEKNEKVD